MNLEITPLQTGGYLITLNEELLLAKDPAAALKILYSLYEKKNRNEGKTLLEEILKIFDSADGEKVNSPCWIMASKTSH